eukprot:XP_764194.1 hypothetical protein [Theileria parva strain Muguga]
MKVSITDVECGITWNQMTLNKRIQTELQIHMINDKNFNEELVVDENTEDSDEKFMNLLKEIYSKGDEETKRAMVKSFTTSSGERLSTNWNSVKDK